jgi:hypothetical protein
MALKDLAASAASVNEAAIESVVEKYVRYDLDDHQIVLTPEAGSLSNRRRILAYLTANEGWGYVDKAAIRCRTSPKDLELPLGMKGGSLRPNLLQLQKENLIRKDASGYRIVAPNLGRIKTEVLGSDAQS